MFTRVLPIAAATLALAACTNTVPFCCAPSAKVTPVTDSAPAVITAISVTPTGYGALVNPLNLGDGKYADAGGKYATRLPVALRRSAPPPATAGAVLTDSSGRILAGRGRRRRRGHRRQQRQRRPEVDCAVRPARRARRPLGPRGPGWAGGPGAGGEERSGVRDAEERRASRGQGAAAKCLASRRLRLGSYLMASVCT